MENCIIPLRRGFPQKWATCDPICPKQGWNPTQFDLAVRRYQKFATRRRIPDGNYDRVKGPWGFGLAMGVANITLLKSVGMVKRLNPGDLHRPNNFRK